MLRLRSPVSASQPFVCLVLCCDSATASIYTLSLHDALPISVWDNAGKDSGSGITFTTDAEYNTDIAFLPKISFGLDRKSTRLNSSHVAISYAVFCLKKKKKLHVLVTKDTRRHPGP